ncbi:hypothetical protein AAF712_002215 [Marasmius tenuissimus]|uniref:Uncharacterized protein n=1 Tax=Marasmius tenuissimus TaxID=585030 RepID=A0ABR3AAM0_9AGAR
MSSSSDSSRSPSPAPAKSKGKSKGKKATERPEEQDLNWAYAPPPTFKLVKDVHDSEDWDWEALNEDKGLELWLIRVPEGVQPKHLNNVSIQLPSSSASSSKSKLGEEIKNITCVLPKRKGKGEMRLGVFQLLKAILLVLVSDVFVAPRPIARRLVVSAQEVTATPPEETDPTLEQQNPKRFSYPKNLLKHKFMPYGSRSHLQSPSEDVEMDVEVPQTQEKEKEKSKKKRKEPTDDSASPRKPNKKTKVAK